MNETTLSSHAETASPDTRWSRYGALFGLLVGPLDTALLHLAGVNFALNGRDAAWLVAAYLGATFAVLGYLLGAAIEGRRRDRHASAVMREQAEMIHATRERLLQSEKLASLGQLATAIAHEVRNPLAIMRSAAQEIHESEPAAGEMHASSFLVDEIDRLNRVIESLLSYAKPLDLELRPVSISQIFERTRLIAERDHSAASIRLDAGASGNRLIHADADLVVQVLLGLLRNAVEARADACVLIEAECSDGRVSLAVSDDGPGIDADMRERIFEPFLSTRRSGTGLGLAIAKQIATAHKGEIRVRDARAGGACFVLALPEHAQPAIAA